MLRRPWNAVFGVASSTATGDHLANVRHIFASFI